MQSTLVSYKHIAKFLGSAVAIVIFFLFASSTHAQVGIPAAGVDLDGYAWSSNIGWISMNCKTGGVTGNDICATSNYKTTVSSTGAVTGYAWSSNVGWIRFGGLSDFPAATGTMAVNARMTGTYPDLTFEGWVRACAGDDMDGGCNSVVVAATSSSLTWTSNTITNNFKLELVGAGNSSNIVYGNAMYAALSSTNQILTSTDGLNWTARTSIVENWQALAYGNNIFVAVAAPGTSSGWRVMTSPDGITWTGRSSPLASQFKSVTYANGLFVAVACGSVGADCDTAAGNRVMTSPDGITWTARTSPAGIWNAVTYGNGLFVAVAESVAPNNVMTSPDGITWTTRTAPNGFWTDIEYGNGRFVATAWTGPTNYLMTSPDGITWTARSVTAENGYTSLVFAAGLFVASWYDTDISGNPASISTSPDGITWTKQSYFEPGPSGRQYSLGASTNMIVGGTKYQPLFQMLNFRGQFATSSYTGTGWDGWISLRSTAAPTHSVVMSSTGASATSYAWGSSVMGWINFDDVRFLAPTATLSGTNCTIPAGAATCNSSFTWNIQNATSPNLRNSTRSVTYTSTAAGTTTPYAIRQGANTVQARDNTTVLASVVVNGTCAAGTDYANGSTCETTVVPAPVITITTNKSIARTGDTVLVSWTMNPSPIASGTCSVTGPGMPASVTTTGSQTSNALTSKTRFTLTCTGPYGTVRASTDVEIIPKASEV